MYVTVLALNNIEARLLILIIKIANALHTRGGEKYWGSPLLGGKELVVVDRLYK